MYARRNSKFQRFHGIYLSLIAQEIERNEMSRSLIWRTGPKLVKLNSAIISVLKVLCCCYFQTRIINYVVNFFLLELYFKAVQEKSKVSSNAKTKKQNDIKDRGFKKSMDTTSELRQSEQNNSDCIMDSKSKTVSASGDNDDNASNKNEDLNEESHPKKTKTTKKESKKRKHTDDKSKDKEDEDIETVAKKKKKKKKKKGVLDEEEKKKKTGSKHTGLISVVKVKKKRKNNINDSNPSLPVIHNFGLGVDNSW